MTAPRARDTSSPPASLPASPPEPSPAAPTGVRCFPAPRSSGRPRGRFRRPLSAWLLACAVLLVLSALPGLGGVAHAQVLVSNTGQTSAPNGTVVKASWATAFTTGSSTGGYNLDSIGIKIHTTPSDQSDWSFLTVGIYSDSSNTPDQLLHTLTNPATFGTGVQTFTAPENAVLRADTTYFVRLTDSRAPRDGNEAGLQVTATGTNEDSGAASGWSIANGSRSQNNVGGSWGTASAPIQISVNGSTVPVPLKVEFISRPANGTDYLPRETVRVKVAFPRAVTVTGTPSIGLEVGAAIRRAAYASHSGSSVLFEWRVGTDDVDTDGLAVPADSLQLDGGTIAAADGTGPMPLAHAALGAQSGQDDDLVALRPQLLHRLQRCDGWEGLASALRLRTVGADGNDVAVRLGPVPLNDVAVVIETAADEMAEIGARVAARCECRLHRVPPDYVNGDDGGGPSPGAPPAAPVPARLALSAT